MKKAKMKYDTPEVPNLFPGDCVLILNEKWEGEPPLRRKKILVRSLERGGVEDWVNETDVELIEE